jgi:hypothetical protein
MKIKSLITLLVLSLSMWAQTANPPAAKSSAPAAKAEDCACCKGMAKDHTCADCCKDGKCAMMKDGAKCPGMKDAKAACMGEKGCCGGMKHEGAKAEAKMGPHCEMGTNGKGCCGGHAGHTGTGGAK